MSHRAKTLILVNVAIYGAVLGLSLAFLPVSISTVVTLPCACIAIINSLYTMWVLR